MAGASGVGAPVRLARVMRAGLFAFILALGAVLTLSLWVGPVDQQVLDAEFRFLRAHAPRPVRNEVVIVGLDDESTRVLREPLTLWHPHVGKFLLAMANSGATAVGLDIVLPDRSYEAIVPGYDLQLLRGIVTARSAMPLVLSLTIDPSGESRPVHERFVFAAGGWDATGYALLPIDGDGVVRRFDERINVSGGAVPTLAGRMAARLGRPVEHGLIDYAAGNAFDYVPLHRVLEWYDAADTAKLRSAFGGKAVLLGGVFRFEDRLVAPVNLLAWDADAVSVPGVVLHAQVLRNLLNDGLIAPAPAWVLPVLGLLAAACFWIAGHYAVAALLTIALGATLIATSTWLLSRGTYLPTGAILLTLLAAVGARVLFEAIRQLRERRRLRRAFGAFVSPDIMRDILRSDPPPGLGGERYWLSVLFADIRDFTARSEQAAPEATILLLNRYFSEMTACVHGAGGTLDKFIGDGVMAFFGAPQRLDNPCLPAMRVAREMLERLPRLNAALMQDGHAPIAIGIGVHAGDAVVGNMGSETRHNYTAIGDAVNVASRLEGLTKEVDFPLVCSALVFENLEDRSGFVKLGLRSIKGHQPVVVYGWRPSEPRPSDPKTETT
jgi:adenylate cyclase